MTNLSEYAMKLLAVIGITDTAGILEPVIERDGAGDAYVKFMSDFGRRDDEQGDAFAAFLSKNNIPHRRGAVPARRTFFDVDIAAVARAVLEAYRERMRTPVAPPTELPARLDFGGSMNSNITMIITANLVNAAPDYAKTIAMNGGAGCWARAKTPEAGIVEARDPSIQTRVVRAIVARYNAFAPPKAGDRVITIVGCDVPAAQSVVPMGATGTVAWVKPHGIGVAIDAPDPALVDWDNELHFDVETAEANGVDLSQWFWSHVRWMTELEQVTAPAPRRVPDLSILYACDGEHTESAGAMRLRELVDRFTESGVDPDEISDLINGVAETGHYIGRHDCGQYAVIRVDRDRRTS